ncbi:dormancy-associated protein homolog 3-like isoform X1 [Glycine soja]|uniref:dormancy-associated protein homolog 3-like isoform X1 n=1 Tax=Glycine soja TaxID=3848 RepID=UPI00103ACF87|nr:dormancy-associated protein homolog 3-like isoform X1 [Glycine soja]
MGLLDHLWDDTVAGPRPENGLGKLRKHHTFTFRPSSGKEAEGGSVRSYGDESSEEATRVTRSIMIVKPPGYQSGSPPVSPAGSTPPISPFSGKEEKIHFGFEEGRDLMRTRREGRTDQALLLLSMCDAFSRT